MTRLIIAHAIEYNDELAWSQIKNAIVEMFAAGEIKIKFCYYGVEQAQAIRPFITTNWIEDADTMVDIMDRGRAGCVCGCYTPIADVLEQALKDAPQAVISLFDTFHGDADKVLAFAQQLRGTRLFFFQQGSTQGIYQQLADLTGGACISFNPHIERIEEKLPDMFAAIASYTVGGVAALEDRNDVSAVLLLEHMTATPFTMEVGKGVKVRDE